MNIPYDEMPEKIEELMVEVERLESENKHLLDLQKSMDKQYEELENNWNKLKKWLLCMSEISHLDLKCLQAVLSKMQEIESGKNE